MPAIKIGTPLSCNSLKVSFYDECQNPSVLRDPYELFYTISKISGDLLCTDEQIITETVDSVPLRSGVGIYYIPSIPKVMITPGNYRIRWKWRENIDSLWRECCQDFTLYSQYDCVTNVGRKSTCSSCF